MVTSIVSLVPASAGADVKTDMKNARTAREQVKALIALLQSQRAEAATSLLKTLATDFSALKDTPTKQFGDTEFTKYTTWATADQELDKRIDAFTKVVDKLDKYVETLAKKHRAEFVAILTDERNALQAELDKDEADEANLEDQIEEVQAEIDKWSSSSSAARKKTPKKKASKKVAKKTATKKRGKRRP